MTEFRSLWDARRPWLLDVFCGAGGATRGYQEAGFAVLGVDIQPQPRYCGDRFIQADAMEILAFMVNLAGPANTLHPSRFAAIHASPPCQGYTTMVAPGQRGAPRLIAEVRTLLEATERPYVIENVEGANAEMCDPITLCGSMFGLGAQGHELRRHRLFESSLPLPSHGCRHSSRPVIGIYGGHARRRSAKHGGRLTKDVWVGGHKEAASKAMGIDWMTLAEMSEAIPPAYTEWIGSRILQHALVEVAA